MWGSSDDWAERERTMSAGVGKAQSFRRCGMGLRPRYWCFAVVAKSEDSPA
ncbi:hypothetical protein HMPREF9058_1907 [Actinomyces sp. oral taxon 175 str. F0384]|nr:hypothetical protein HMPREF9058_1907 [Actinomyces sp. oral taxon 175 str. F0384]